MDAAKVEEYETSKDQFGRHYKATQIITPKYDGKLDNDTTQYIDFIVNNNGGYYTTPMVNGQENFSGPNIGVTAIQNVLADKKGFKYGVPYRTPDEIYHNGFKTWKEFIEYLRNLNK